MEAHRVLKNAGIEVDSYGTGSAVRLPGLSIDQPNIFTFGTPYDEIYTKLKTDDVRLYTQNGVLKMIDRNRKLKKAPEKWQESKKRYDLIITCEERCFDAVIEGNTTALMHLCFWHFIDLQNRGENQNKIVHVVNIDIKDNHEEAAVGAQAILELVKNAIDAADSNQLEDQIPRIISKWQQEYPRLPLLHSVSFY